MFTHSHGVTYKNDAGSITSTTHVYTGNSERNYQAIIPVSTTDSPVVLTFPTANIVSSVLYSDRALTIKTNSTAVSTNSHRFLIYYGIPITVNGSATAQSAAAVFSQYDTVVFGDGLEDPVSPNNANTAAVIAAMKVNKPGIQVYGYIDLGVTTQNNSIPTITTKIGQWKTTGATGIFLDDAGYDFHTSRQRQNDAIDAVHAASVPVILNAFTAADVLDPAVDATYNAGGVGTHLTIGDGYLIESWVVNSVAYSGTGGWETSSDIKTRGDAAQSYRATLGIKVYAEGSVRWGDVSAPNQALFFAELEALSSIYSWDGYGMDTYQFGAAAPNQDVVRIQPYSLAYDTLYNPAASYSYNSGTSTYTRAGISVALTSHAVTFAGGSIISLRDKQQIAWANDHPEPNPFAQDVTTIYVTNASTIHPATFDMRVLLNL